MRDHVFHLSNKNKPYWFPRPDEGEAVDVLTYVLHGSGWQILCPQLSGARIRILSRLASESIVEAFRGDDEAELRRIDEPSHAKAVIYRKQRFSIIGSFNVTGAAFTRNIETFIRVDGDAHDILCQQFDCLWREGKSKFPPDERIQTFEPDPEPLDEPLQPLPFQLPVIDEVARFLGARRRASGRILKLPTGAGKTLVVAEALRRHLEENPDARVLWVCHSREVLGQSFRRLRAQLRATPRLFRRDFLVRPDMVDPERRCLASEIESLRATVDSRRIVFETQQSIPQLLASATRPFSVVIVDECHRYHAGAGNYMGLEGHIGAWRARRLGLTATPPAPGTKARFEELWDAEDLIGSGVTRERLQTEGILSRWNEELSQQRPTGLKLQIDKRDERLLVGAVAQIQRQEGAGSCPVGIP